MAMRPERAGRAGLITVTGLTADFAAFALRKSIPLKMPAKRKRMHQVTKDDSDSVPLAHRTTESDLSRKHRFRKGGFITICQNETTPEPNYLGQTKRQNGEMQREESTCLHDRKGPQCKTSGGGASMCIHARRKSRCKECGGVGICIHGRQKSRCKECGGVSMCIHGREKSRCKECGGVSICIHGRRKSRCKECVVRPQTQT